MLNSPRQYPHILENLFRAARQARERHFADSVFLYGFLFTGAYCRNLCAFCLYRAGNPHAPRYRKTPEEILTAAVELARSGVRLIDLTMREDLMWFSEPADRATSFSPLLSMVSEIKKNTGLPVMVSPGVLPDDIMPLLRPAGADWFACYQEIYNRELFARIRPGQDYNQRLRPRQIRAMSFVPQPGVPMKASRPLIP